MQANAAAASAFGVLALMLSSCGGGDSAESADKSGTDSGAQRIEVADTSVGDVLVDKDGKTLYMFTKDVKGRKSVCAADCLAAWPPLGRASAGDGTDSSLVGTIKRGDGSTQATYDGWPLYYYVKDKARGDVTGQGVGAVWYAVGPDGNVVKKKPETGGTGGGGGY